MRGKRLPNGLRYAVLRITPADAGKTYRTNLYSYLPRDHPRGCGENEFAPLSVHGTDGSPPRMRGKRAGRIDCNACIWITPADAGKTVSAANAVQPAWDHPRGCGENGYVPDRRQRRIGSPPRMRGKRIGAMSATVTNRITPADAGKT